MNAPVPPAQLPVHAHVGDVERTGGFVDAEEDHLRVLTAELDGAAGARIELLDGAGVCDDFLQKRHVKCAGQGRRARPGKRKAHASLRKRVRDKLKRGANAFGLARAVTLIGRVQKCMGARIERADFRGGRADVDADVDG